jgi:hypothetical protein
MRLGIKYWLSTNCWIVHLAVLFVEVCCLLPSRLGSLPKLAVVRLDLKEPAIVWTRFPIMTTPTRVCRSTKVVVPLPFMPPPFRPCSVRSGLRGIRGDSIPFYTNLYRRGLNPLQSPLNPFKPNKPLLELCCEFTCDERIVFYGSFLSWTRDETCCCHACTMAAALSLEILRAHTQPAKKSSRDKGIS